MTLIGSNNLTEHENALILQLRHLQLIKNTPSFLAHPVDSRVKKC